MCVVVEYLVKKCTEWINSNKPPALLHPTSSVPHTNTRTTTLGSHLRWARSGQGPCLQAAPVPRFPAPSHWHSTQPQPPSTGRQAKWLDYYLELNHQIATDFAASVLLLLLMECRIRWYAYFTPKC